MGRGSYSFAGVGTPLAWRWIALESATALVVFTGLFFCILAASPGPVEPDTLWHWRTARLILERGPWVPLDNLPYTVLGTRGTDHYWFIHLLQAPLTLLGEDLKDIHLAAAIFGAAVPAAYLAILWRACIPYAPVVVLLMVSAAWMVPFRLLSLRGQNFAVPMMLVMMFAMLGKRHWVAGIGAFFFMQGYHAAVILGMFCVVIAASQWWEEGRIDQKTPLAVFYGVALGLFLSPWFPDNVRYLLFHTLFKVAQGQQSSGLLGTEWYQPSWSRVWGESWRVHVLFGGTTLLAAVLSITKGVRWSIAAIAFCAVTFICLCMYKVVAARFGEYYVPFAVVSAGLIWRDLVAKVEWPRRWTLDVPGLVLAIFMAWTLWSNPLIAHGVIGPPMDRYEAAIKYVKDHDPNPMIFNSRWSDFPVVFFNAPRAKLVAGMDGYFLMYGDSDRFALWYGIVTHRALGRSDLAATIHDKFGARWALIDENNDELMEVLSRDPDARLRVADEGGWLFELKGRGEAWK